LKVLITGCSGFVGSYALDILKQTFEVTPVSLQKTKVEDINFDGVDTILHLAGLAHQMQKIDPDEYFKVNHRLTLSFARAAQKSGVKHFVFISSVKVYGDQVSGVIDEYSECHPTDPYGESKLKAENELLSISNDNFVVSIIRPPLIYGPRVKGNLERLTGLINKLPILPFGNIKNQRAMVFVGNLTALIVHILKTKPQGVFIAGDKKNYSTSHLVETMMQFMKVNKKNISIPLFMRSIIKYFKPAIHTRLFESYIISNQSTNKKLSFEPPYSFEEGIKEMVQNIN